MKDLPPHVYMHSYLQKAGVRFYPNVVDTCVKKGLSLSFYAALAMLALCIALHFVFHRPEFLSCSYFYCIFATIFLYAAVFLLRYLFFSHIRRKLRMDNSPVAVEAYAVVLFDMLLNNPDRLITPRKCAVLYKECGSKKPRFFCGPLKNRKHCRKFSKDQMALVFPDRTNDRFYSVEDDKLYKTASEKKKNSRCRISAVEAGVNKVSEQ